MLHPRPSDWPITNAEHRQGLPSHGRHEIALERYLEKQASQRASAARRWGLQADLIRFRAQLAQWVRNGLPRRNSRRVAVQI
jgi:hypothetical protein